MKRFIALILPCLFSASLAHTETPDLNQQYVHYIASGIGNYKTLGDLISTTNIRFGDYVYLKRKLKDVLHDKLPEVREVNDSLQFITKEMTVTVKPISVKQGKFEVNGKKLTLLGLSAEQRWDLIAKALPKSEAVSLMNFVLPRAEAQPFKWVTRAATALISTITVTATGTSITEFLSTRNKEYNSLCSSEYDKAIAICGATGGLVATEQRRAQVVRVTGKLPSEGSATTAEQAAANAEVVQGVVEARAKGEKQDCAKLPISESVKALDEKVLNNVTKVIETEANSPLWTNCPKDKKESLDQCIGELVGAASVLCAQQGESAWKRVGKRVIEPTTKEIEAGKTVKNAAATEDLPEVKKVDTAKEPSGARR